MVRHVSLFSPGQRVDRHQIVARSDVGHNVPKRPRRRSEVETGDNLHRRPARLRDFVDVVFDDPVDRLDRFATEQLLSKGVGVHGSRGHRHVVRLVARVHKRRADVRVQRTEAAARKIASVAAGVEDRLIVGHVRLGAAQDQPAFAVEDTQRQVGARHAVGVVDIEDRRPQNVPAAGQIEVELVPIDVALCADIAADAQSAEVRRQQVA